MLNFTVCFKALTGYEPFSWQQKLYERFVRGEIPDVSDIPTGLGKTSVIAVWLIALAHHLSSKSSLPFPRRLVYVVDRRTVVDQSTDEAESLVKKIENPDSTASPAETNALRLCSTR